MKQNWVREGLFYNTNGIKDWRASHAALPTTVALENGNLRIYYTSRDKENRAHVGFFEVHASMPNEVLRESEQPVLAPGNLGYFDGQGVQCTSIWREGSDWYMMYLGWCQGSPPPLFYTAMGLAVSHDEGLTFHKVSEAPVLDRSSFDPWMVSGGTIRKLGSDYIMYYLSGFQFNWRGAESTSRYNIKIAWSKDLINWHREGQVAIPLLENETNISRLSIIQRPSLWHAWFPVKRNGFPYRAGYAESIDGIHWTRKDDAVTGFEMDENFKEETVDKMDVFSIDDDVWMLYNGNGFGKHGILKAVWKGGSAWM